LDAEALALSSALGELEFQQHLWGELTAVGGSRERLQTKRMTTRGTLVTDCKSLYDLLANGHGMPEGKRTAIEIVLMRECLKETGNSIRWVPSYRMAADGLTKEGEPACRELRRVMDEGVIILAEPKLAGHSASEKKRASDKGVNVGRAE
jgi:hypothetical protein